MPKKKISIRELANDFESKVEALVDEKTEKRISNINKELENLLSLIEAQEEWKEQKYEVYINVLSSVSKRENRYFIEEVLEMRDLQNTDFFKEFGENIGGTELFKIFTWLGMVYWGFVIYFGLANGFTEETFFTLFDWIAETRWLSIILLPCAIANLLYGIGGWIYFFAVIIKRVRRNKLLG